jgi:hypothetical protein
VSAQSAQVLIRFVIPGREYNERTRNPSRRRNIRGNGFRACASRAK